MNIFEPDPYRGPSTPAPAPITFGEIARRRAEGFRPPQRMTVSEAAEAYRMVRTAGGWRKFDNADAPYMVEPQDQITSRRFRAVVFAGPARCGKTVCLIENPVAHAIRCHPRTTAVFQMSQTSARGYSIEKIGPMIRNSPELRRRQIDAAANLLDKEFIGDMRLTIGWPVAAHLASRDIALVLQTEFDKYPLNVEGEGSPFALGLKRTQTEGSLAKLVAESSPRHLIKSEAWKPTSPHEAPPCDGILSLYNDGTRGRFYYHCLECGDPFEPLFDRLEYDRAASSPGAAAADVVLVCPHCGGVMEQAQRRDLNAGGRWLHETKDGGVAPLGSETREATTVSYWLAPLPAFAVTWSELVARWEEAKRKAEAPGGDDAALVAVTNLDLGRPYLPKVTTDAEDLDADTLRARATDYPLGVAPSWTRFVTITVDTQKHEFRWQAEAWGPALEHRIIDSGRIFKAPGADRPLDPARYQGDWKALDELEARRFPIEGEAAEIAAVGIVVDMQGEPGVTDKARRFWLEKKAAGRALLWHVSRGHGGLRYEKRVWRARPETASKKKRVRRDVPILNFASDRLKSDLYAHLTKEGGGAQSLGLSVRLDRSEETDGDGVDVFAELAAERLTDKGWRKKKGVVRNEAFDLSYYALGLAIALKAETINYDDPPAWAAPWPRNSNVTRTGESSAAVPEPAPASAEPTASPKPAAPPKPVARKRTPSPSRGRSGRPSRW